MDVVAFQQKWIGASNLKEKTASQSHFNDLCDQSLTRQQSAHAALDRAVWDVYGWPDDEVPADVESPAGDRVDDPSFALRGSTPTCAAIRPVNVGAVPAKQSSARSA